MSLPGCPRPCSGLGAGPGSRSGRGVPLVCPAPAEPRLADLGRRRFPRRRFAAVHSGDWTSTHCGPPRGRSRHSPPPSLSEVRRAWWTSAVRAQPAMDGPCCRGAGPRWPGGRQGASPWRPRAEMVRLWAARGGRRPRGRRQFPLPCRWPVRRRCQPCTTFCSGPSRVRKVPPAGLGGEAMGGPSGACGEPVSLCVPGPGAERRGREAAPAHSAVGVAACPAAVGLPVAPVIPLALACGGGGRGQQRRGLLPELGAPGTALSLLPR